MQEITLNIINWLGGYRSFSLMTGITWDKMMTIKAESKLRMKLPRNSSKANYLYVQYDECNDLYNIEFISSRKYKGEITTKTILSCDGLDGEQLRYTFIETTGLDLRVPTIIGFNN